MSTCRPPPSSSRQHTSPRIGSRTSRPPIVQQRNATTGSSGATSQNSQSDSRTRTNIGVRHNLRRGSSDTLIENVETHAGIGTSAPMPSPDSQKDAQLLRASLDEPGLEEAAEATLWDILERRQLAFQHKNHTGSSFLAPLRHRRHRTHAGTLSMNQFSHPFEGTHRLRLANSIMENDTTPILGRSFSRSKRNLLWETDDSYMQENETDNGGGYYTNNSNQNDDDDNEKNNTLGVKPTVSNNKLGTNDTIASFPASIMSESSHKVTGSSYSALSDMQGYSQSQNWSLGPYKPMGNKYRSDGRGNEGSSIARERALHLAMAMKTCDPIRTMEEHDEEFSLSQGRGFNELVNLVEAKREYDENSRGSTGENGNEKRIEKSTAGFLECMSRNAGSQDGQAFTQANGGLRDFAWNKSKHERRKPFAGISSPLGNNQGKSSIDMMFQVVDHVQELCQIPEEDESEGTVPLGIVSNLRDSNQSQKLAFENAHFLEQIINSHPDIPEIPLEDVDEAQELGYVRANERTPMIEKAQVHQNISYGARQSIHRGNFTAVNLWINRLRRQSNMLWVAFDLDFVKMKIWMFITYDLSCVIIPLIAVATYFYYRLGNPSFPFLPTDVSVSWWILFAIRLYFTLQLAYVTEYIFVDVLAMRSPISVKMIGPLATLYTINAKGWPFVLTFWGLWNFSFLHGTCLLQNHWLSFTGIEMWNASSKGDSFLGSEIYTDILLSMIVAGVVTSIKRTILALYLGKRVYMHYKPKLEKLMIEMLLLTEVAELARALKESKIEETDNPLKNDTPLKISSNHQLSFRASTMVDFVKNKQAKDVTVEDGSDSDDDGIDRQLEESNEPIKSWNRLLSPRPSSVVGENQLAKKSLLQHNIRPEVGVGQQPCIEFKSKAQEDSVLFDLRIGNNNDEGVLPASRSHDDVISECSSSLDAATATLEEDKVHSHPPLALEHVMDEEHSEIHEDEPRDASINESLQGVLHQGSTTAQIKSLLDRWEEPVNKLDKRSDPTIHEILQFRKALSFLEDTNPFGISFGPAHSRDTCIQSSKTLYKCLLGFNPDSTVLHFDVIGVLAYDAYGTFDEKKATRLVRLFRPDKFDEVTLLAFVQSCDGVYKKLRYLRASVGNSTSIDHVLENIFNGFFNFFLFLAVLNIMKLNPWTLLVSLSTVFVSFAFALGPSAAKLIEGMMMIAIRRPFDLGDRISICDPVEKPAADDPGYHDTWIVEDCNLFSTTLRLSRTNEIATINNGTLSNSKIVNHGRSNNALVNILLPMRFDITHEQVQIVRSSVEQYVCDNPRVWTSLVNWHIAHVDPNLDLITFSIRVQHVKSWQDNMCILHSRGDLLKFCTEILIKLGVEYHNPAFPYDLFLKEIPENKNFKDVIEPAHNDLK